MSQTKAQLIDGKVATVEFSGGSASAPSIAFSGDTNTGIYSPGADQVAISTGGSGNIFFRNGRIGVGESNPSGLIEWRSTNIGRLEADASVVTINAATNAPLVFKQNDTERMRLTATGLGIGTSSPSYLLDASGSGSIGIRYKSTGAYGSIVSDNSSATGGGLFVAQQNGSTKASFGASGGIEGNTSSDAALFAETGGAIRFYTNGSATAKAILDSSGRLLLGTSDGSGSVGRIIVQGASNGSATGVLQIAYNGSATAPLTAGTQLGFLRFTDQASSGQTFAEIRAEVDATTGANDYPGRLVFSTTADGASSPTERMRLDNKGSLSLWNPSNTTAGPQDVDGRIFAYSDGSNSNLYVDSRRSDAFVHINQSFGDTANRGAVAFYRNESQIGSISISSAQVFYNTTSDHRLKENVVDLEGATELVKQLQPRQFNFISEPDKVVRGFIAHEVQAIAPEAVTGEKDAEDENGNPKYQGIDQSKLVPLLTAALQEAVARIEQLETAVATLQGQ